jgi:two-component system sensor histidine kinase/response regulator
MPVESSILTEPITTTHRILIADDNASIHSDIKTILSGTRRVSMELREMERELFEDEVHPGGTATDKYSYAYEHAYQGEEAVAQVRKAIEEGDPFSIIFMDVRMPPGMDGIQATRAIREIDPDVEIVIATAYSDYSWEDIVDELGYSDKVLFLKKPIDPTALRQTTLTLTTKWVLQQEHRNHTRNLEQEVDRRTTELQEMVEQFKELKQRAERATEEKSDFLARMSHEIRTPASSIIGMNELLLETDLDAEQRQYAETATGSARALIQIINDILDHSKLEAGKFELQRERVSFGALLNQTILVLKGYNRNELVRIKCQIDDAIPGNLLGDPGRIQQILLNYGSNALKFTRQGEVCIEISLLTDEPEFGVVRLSVSDTGIGISKENLNNHRL